MSKLQKYLIPLQSNVKLSDYYATSYLQIKPSLLDFKKISQAVSFANQTLHENIKRLKQGHYDSLSIPLRVQPCSPLKHDLPYDALTTPNIDKLLQGSINNTIISPHQLNTDLAYPKDFRFIGSKIQTNDFHVSLLPLIRFEKEEESTHFYNHFKQSNISTHQIPCKFNGKLNIFPKFDYTKFFLALDIDKSDLHNGQLLETLTKLSSLRTTTSFSPGHVIGEIGDQLIDWSQSSLHMTIGVCNIPNPPLIDHQDLCYVNDVLLKDIKIEPLHLKGNLTFVINNQHLRFS